MKKRTTISSTMTMNNSVSRRVSLRAERIGYLLILFSALGLDRLVKILSVSRLKQIGSVDLIPGVFRLTYCENTGAAFSILSGKTAFFIIVTLILTGLIAYLVLSGKVRSALCRVCLVSVAAGGIGNLIDRIAYGYVVDTFDFYLIDFAVFNVADIFVTCGGILFVMVYLCSKGDVVDL